jgi:hypothetical protein
MRFSRYTLELEPCRSFYQSSDRRTVQTEDAILLRTPTRSAVLGSHERLQQLACMTQTQEPRSRMFFASDHKRAKNDLILDAITCML